MKPDERTTKRFQELSDQAEALSKSAKEELGKYRNTGTIVTSTTFLQWRASALTLLQHIFGENSPHVIEFQTHQKIFNHWGSALLDCNAVFQAAKQDYENGYIFAEVLPNITVTREGVFFAGQHFDALQRTTEILSQAQQEITIVDGYIDESVLDMLTSKAVGVSVQILTRRNGVSPALKTAATAFNKQYQNLSIRTSGAFHDRFVIIDDRDFYHFGASSNCLAWLTMNRSLEVT